MPRLPEIGADADKWGVVLNEFLRVAHNEDGRLRGTCAVINVHDFGAKGDGATNLLADDTDALQAAFDAVPADGAVVCVPPGVYMVNKKLALKSKSHLKGAGSGSLFKRIATGTEIIFFSEGVSDVTVEAIAVDLNGAGQGAQKNFATGIAFRTGSAHLRIRDCRVFDSTGTTVMGRMGILVLESNHVWLERNHLSDGLRLKAGGVGDRLIIENNFIEDPNDNGIAIATFDAPSHTVNYIIRGNTIKAARGAFIYIGDDGFGVLANPDPSVTESGIIYQNLLIDGNILLGPVQANQAMIMVTLANVTERIHIVNNILSNINAVPGAIAGIETAIQTPFGGAVPIS